MPDRPLPDPAVPPSSPDPTPGWMRWLRRVGWAGFAFFLVKGLLWLTVPTLLVALGVRC